ncbi:hypothetical protein LTR53_000502 [Teratosphaeriaceae sp. CCFEE 6253]|nr:hypothetical protein LTR53_000502 [Teratosphaeriaceae sp. CCFEE 6253]
MKVSRTLSSVLLAVCLLNTARAVDNLRQRQDLTTGDSQSTQASSSGASSAASGTAASTSSDGSSRVSTTATQQETTTARSSTADDSTTSGNSQLATTVASMTSSSPITSASVVASTTAKALQLPIKPVITPALGIAGCLLIVAGAALCIGGIKHQWLHIFLSTALLASLAVTVLIIYVMNPPVSNAIQGAYMVAAVLTGLIFGAVALVFKDITDGLGCLLGGFTLAMWFLVLSPGGLISSTSGRAILIAVFCLVFFGLYFSHYTRTYGLILGTSFAGAQVTVLGVDCFSRAGLKEFWLYIWDLNKDAFPINTTTYPITRGIRVEIACTVIMFLFGVMSQCKIWKVVKERKARKDVDRLQEVAHKDELEASVGRDVEANNQRDLEDWEAAYGDRDHKQVHVDSGVGSSVESLPQKRSISVREREVGGHELADMSAAPHASPSKARRSGSGAERASSRSQDEGKHDAPPRAEQDLLGSSPVSRSTSHSSRQGHTASSPDPDDAPNGDLAQHDGPSIVPLPFTIPSEDDEQEQAQDIDSVHSRGTVGQSVHGRRGLTLKRHFLERGRSEDRIDSDRASSVAATADGEADDDRLSVARQPAAPSPYILDFDREGLLQPARKGRDRSRSPNRSLVDEALEEDDDEAIVRPSTSPGVSTTPLPRAASKLKRRISADSSHNVSKGTRSSLYGDEEENASLVGSLKRHLPPRLSKVAQTYRTNEWAKHIADADEPAGESGDGSHSPGIQVDHAFAEEAARPVDTEALMPAEAQTSRNVSQRHSKNPYRRSIQTSASGPSRNRSGATTPVCAFQRSSSAMSLSRQVNSESASGQPRSALRKSSTPLMSQTLVESPIEDALAEPYRNVSSSMSMASQYNLMGERQQRVNRNPSSMSFNVPTSSTPDLKLITQSDSESLQEADPGGPYSATSPSDRKQLFEEEGMTLAERKALIQAQSASPQSPVLGDRSRSRQSSLPTPPGPAHGGKPVYDSHQPKRSNTIDTGKKATMLTNWRQSLQQETAAKQPLFTVDDGARETMMSERRRVQHEQGRQEAERAKRASIIDNAMRTGQLHGAHRDAMRRLQAQANKHAE